MIQIIIKKSSAPRLFDRMPLPRSNNRTQAISNRLTKNITVRKGSFGLFQSSGGLSKYQTAPFVRKVSKIS